MAETSPGIGSACSFWVSEVSTWERMEKKVERSGRRGGVCVVEGALGTLCSTDAKIISDSGLKVAGGGCVYVRTFVGCHDRGLGKRS